MDKLTLLYIAFLAVVIILAVCFFALNDSCKKSEQLSEELANRNDLILKEYRKLMKNYSELAGENKDLKDRLLYERTKDDANVL